MRNRLLFPIFLLLILLFPLTSYNHTTQNIQLEGAPLLADTEHDITQFTKTSDNDVMLYQDAQPNETLDFADYGYAEVTPVDEVNNYTYMEDKDASYWSCDGSAAMGTYVWNYTISVPVTGFTFALYGYMGGGVRTLQVYDYASESYRNIDNLPTSSPDWLNESIFGNFQQNNNITFRVIWLVSNQIFLDYFEISCFYIGTYTEGYREPFVDVSEWENGGTWIFEDGGGYSSDGDVLSIEGANDGGSNDFEGIYYDGFSIPNIRDCYIEIRYKLNTTSIDHFVVDFYSSNNPATPTTDRIVQHEIENTAWTSLKLIIGDFDNDIDPSSTTAEAIGLFGWTDAGEGPWKAEIDYVYVGLASEMGFQHDGSTTFGINATLGGTTETDGDEVTLTADGDGSTWYFHVDNSETEAWTNLNDYPMFEISITGSSGMWKLRQYDGAYDVIQDSTTIIWDTLRYNIGSVSNNIREFRIDLSANGYLTFDYMQVYSINNYTITDSGTDTDDIVYASGGVLYSEMNNGSLTLELDPYIYFDANITNGYSWNKSKSLGDSHLAFNQESGWTDYTTDTSGYLYNETTDLRIQLNESSNVINIIFEELPVTWHLINTVSFSIDSPEWNLINTIIFSVNAPFSGDALDGLFMIAGMIMIPSSTLLVAYSFKKRTMSRDKVFLLLLMFIMGWGLLLGGIL